MTVYPCVHFSCFSCEFFLVISACSVGYFGPNCSLSCRYPNYGLGCQLNCNCETEHCNHITGCQTSSIAASTDTGIYTLHINKHACLFFPIFFVYLFLNSSMFFLKNTFLYSCRTSIPLLHKGKNLQLSKLQKYLL